MYFVISAGGTAGHINPAIAVADELRSRGHEILFVGTPDHIEAELAVKAGFEFKGFSVAGFDKAKPWTLISSGMKLSKATSQAKKMFKAKRPDAVLGFGAYVSIPVGRAAASMGIPLIIHEQNSVPGMANSYLAKKADITAVTYASSASHLQAKGKLEIIGNPVRASFETESKQDARAALGLSADGLVLLVFGGSLGAQHLNEAVCAMKDQLLAIDGLHVIHSTGQRDHDAVLERLSLTDEQATRWEVRAYIDNMSQVLASADLVISRAGASSLAEIMTVGVPSVLVPYPYARGDHQTLNAASCVEAGAAQLVADKDVESPEFSDLVLDLLSSADKRQQMAQACEAMSGSRARTMLADMAIDIAKENTYE